MSQYNPRRLTIWTLILLVLTAPCAVIFNWFNQPFTAQSTGVVTMELQPALELIVKLLNDITFVAAAAPLVVALTAIFKRFIPTTISAPTIAITMQVLVWVAWVLAKHFGYEEQFGTWTNAFTTILSAIVGLAGSAFVATRIYHSAHNQKIPLLGSDKRPASG